MFIDTNIVSNVKRQKSPRSIKGARISSVVASELLLVYGERRTAANYYVPNLSSIHVGMAGIGSLKPDHPSSKRVTDSIVFSFGNDFDSLQDFGSRAISKMVNERNVELLKRSIFFLKKAEQKFIKEDFDFLINNEIECVPLSEPIAERAYRYLEIFQESSEHFRGTFRNTWNDLLILATAAVHGDTVVTEDTQLHRLLASSFGKFRETEPESLEIELSHHLSVGSRKTNEESKGYLNMGWKSTFRNGGKGRRQAW